MSKKKLTNPRRSFLRNTVKASLVGAAAAGFPHIWMKQGNVYAANKEIKVGNINSSALSQMISFQPYFSNGTLKGYQIYPGNQSKLFDSSGLKSGDVLVAVNGLDIKDPSVLKELSSFGQVKLDLIRDDDDLSIIVKLN